MNKLEKGKNKLIGAVGALVVLMISLLMKLDNKIDGFLRDVEHDS